MIKVVVKYLNMVIILCVCVYVQRVYNTFIVFIQTINMISKNFSQNSII
jgi:hypothetical protein